MMYRQCKVVKDGGSRGSYVDVVWIPLELGRKGKRLTIDGTTGWTVVEAYSAERAETIEAVAGMSRRFRERGSLGG